MLYNKFLFAKLDAPTNSKHFFVKQSHYQIQERISNILRKYSLNEQTYLSKEATAYAYANLLLEDPELVTDRHIRILQKDLTDEQIIAITHYVLEQIGENAYVNAFRQRCSRVLNEAPIEVDF